MNQPRRTHDEREVLVFAPSRRDERILHVSEVPSGLACDCFCPTCKGPLIARKGDRKIHHFGHHRSEVPCAGAVESAVHLYAKQLIAERKALTVPAVVVERDGYAWTGSPRAALGFYGAFVERDCGDFRPDVQLVRPDMHLLGEVLVTHNSDEEKTAKIARVGLPAVEVDVSALRWMNLESQVEIDRWIIHDAPRHWLFTPETAIGHREIEIALWELARKEGIELARMYANYVRSIGGLPRDPPEVRRLADRGLASVLGDETGGVTGFVWMHPVALKALIVEDFVFATDLAIFDTRDILEFLSSRWLLCRRFVGLPPAVTRAMEAAGVPTGGAEGWVTSFIESAAEALTLEQDDEGYWCLGTPLYMALAGERYARREVAVTGVRTDSVMTPTIVERVASKMSALALACGMDAEADPGRWICGAGVQSGSTSLVVPDTDDPRWVDVERELDSLLAASRQGVAPPGASQFATPYAKALKDRADRLYARLCSALGRSPTPTERQRAVAVLSHPAVLCHGEDWASENDAVRWLGQVVQTHDSASKAQVDLTGRYWLDPAALQRLLSQRRRKPSSISVAAAS